jgi:hypothetical protein
MRRAGAAGNAGAGGRVAFARWVVSGLSQDLHGGDCGAGVGRRRSKVVRPNITIIPLVRAPQHLNAVQITFGGDENLTECIVDFDHSASGVVGGGASHETSTSIDTKNWPRGYFRLNRLFALSGTGDRQHLQNRRLLPPIQGTAMALRSQ